MKATYALIGLGLGHAQLLTNASSVNGSNVAGTQDDFSFIKLDPDQSQDVAALVAMPDSVHEQLDKFCNVAFVGSCKTDDRFCGKTAVARQATVNGKTSIYCADAASFLRIPEVKSYSFDDCGQLISGDFSLSENSLYLDKADDLERLIESYASMKCSAIQKAANNKCVELTQKERRSVVARFVEGKWGCFDVSQTMTASQKSCANFAAGTKTCLGSVSGVGTNSEELKQLMGEIKCWSSKIFDGSADIGVWCGKLAKMDLRSTSQIKISELFVPMTVRVGECLQIELVPSPENGVSLYYRYNIFSGTGYSVSEPTGTYTIDITKVNNAMRAEVTTQRLDGKSTTSVRYNDVEGCRETAIDIGYHAIGAATVFVGVTKLYETA